MAEPMIRVLVVDDHPAMRNGLQGALRGEPGIAGVASVGTAREALTQALTRAFDVVLLDYNLPDTDGLLLCRELKAERPELKVLVFSAFASESLKVPAALAGADAILDKGAPLDELLDMIRRVSRSDDPLFTPSRAAQEHFVATLDPEHLPIVAMLLDGTPQPEVAATLCLDVGAVEHQLRAIIARPALRPSLR